MKIGSLCSGYGGLDLGLMSVVPGAAAWHVEYDKHPSTILETRFPGVPNYGDIKTTDWLSVEPIDWLTAGYPCQPFSHAGRRLGEEDPRHLWPYVANAISALRPANVFLENVRGHLTKGFDTVLGSLADLGYDARWCCVRASDVGAPHRRERIFILASGSSEDPDVAVGDQWRQPASRQTEGGWSRPDIGRRSGTPSVNSDCSGFSELRGSRAVRAEQFAVECCRDTLTNTGSQRHGFGENRPRMGFVDRGDEDEARQRERPRQESFDRSVAMFGEYAPAIRRWERVFGHDAPRPTESGRLSPRFEEWMMGLPAGWVTDVDVPRNAQLKALGNGVVPQQAALALRLLSNACGEQVSSVGVA